MTRTENWDALLDSLRENRDGAIAALYEHLSYLRPVAADAPDGSDLLHDVLLRIVTAFRKSGAAERRNRIRNFRAWCLRVASNLSRSRARWRRPSQSLDVDDGETALVSLPEAREPGNDQEFQASILAALRWVRGEDLDLLRLRYVENMQLKDMVEILAARGRPTTEEALRSRLRRVRTLLRDILRRQGLPF